MWPCTLSRKDHLHDRSKRLLKKFSSRRSTEQLVYGQLVGPACDVWALGCTLLQLLTGRSPWQEIKWPPCPPEEAHRKRVDVLRRLVWEEKQTPLTHSEQALFAGLGGSGGSGEDGVDGVREEVLSLLRGCFTVDDVGSGSPQTSRLSAAQVHQRLDALVKRLPAKPMLLVRTSLSSVKLGAEQVDKALESLELTFDPVAVALERAQETALERAQNAALERQRETRAALSPAEAALERAQEAVLERQRETRAAEGRRGAGVADAKRAHGAARKPRSPVKPRGVEATGTVQRWLADKGFGFVRADGGGKDVYVGKAQLPEGQTKLRQGQRVRFGLQEFDDGRRSAWSLQLL